MPEEVSNLASESESREATAAQTSNRAEKQEEPQAECANGVCVVVWKPSRAA